ncbi:ParB N-terminal domain-containing protein [Paramicrobacterium fandaimingii]|uniref:ParB N-terminal domain-containing protein n=1 Tax=Paramicrobacterium fandaimingii TaxID=2708079 RepID=UPI001420A0E8|nr:ParB/RepB/Spo0J family partition protein [Microbacterium fandaimingii]
MSVEMERTVDSIQVGARHRTEIGDLTDLVTSIRERGLLQPITVTPTGVLVCGARRLAAIKQLGWRTVNVWVRSGISTQLEHVLAEHDDHILAKPLTQLEAATLYRELKHLLAEDARQRETATRFSAENQPGTDGGGNFPPPSDTPDTGPVGKTREQAAGMIPGAASYRTLDKIGYLQQHAADETLPAEVREQLSTELQAIEHGGPVQPAYERAHALIDQHHADRDAHLDDLAQAALARAQQSKTKNKKKSPAARPGLPLDGMWPTRRFVLIWDELDSWWTHYDADTLAAELSPEQVAAFLTIVTGTQAFADQLRTALATHAAETDSTDGAEAGATGAGVRHLRAL